MFAVALAELHRTAEEEATDLAEDLACTVYDARLLLAGGLPAIVRKTPDRAQALDLLARLRARGHGAVACDVAACVASAAMGAMRRFRLEADAIALDEGGDRLPYEDVLALVAAVHRSRTETETKSREVKFSMGRALMTSGMSMTKTVTKESHATTEQRESVLYVFRRSGATPWLLREHGTTWAGNGLPLAPTASENFKATVAALRARAPGAAYDDRLVTRRVGERAALSGGAGTTTVKTSSDGAIDLLAHVLALWLARTEAYR